MAFRNKAQVWKFKLQSDTDPPRLVHVMYCANKIQSYGLISNVLKVIYKGKGSKIEIAIHQEAAFQTDSKRKIPYKITTNRMKGNAFPPIIEKCLSYTAPLPQFRNILAIHLISALSSDPESKYLISGYQQRFVPITEDFLAYQPHYAFSAYLSYSGIMSVIL